MVLEKLKRYKVRGDARTYRNLVYYGLSYFMDYITENVFKKPLQTPVKKLICTMSHSIRMIPAFELGKGDVILDLFVKAPEIIKSKTKKKKKK